MANNTNNPCTVIVHGNITVGADIMAIDPPDVEYFLRIPFTARSGKTEGYAACADVTMPDKATFENTTVFANGDNILVFDRREGLKLLAKIECENGYRLNHMGKPLYCCNSSRYPTDAELAEGWQVVNS